MHPPTLALVFSQRLVSDNTLTIGNALAPGLVPSETGATINWFNTIVRFWPRLVVGFQFLAALLASAHALLNKRDSRAATLWLGTIWFLPVLGPILYLVLRINRIRRRDRK